MSDVPTNSFRFVRKRIQRQALATWPLGETVTVDTLQQLFWIGGGPRSEWRDVPVIEEESPAALTTTGENGA